MNIEKRVDALEQLVAALVQSKPDAPADHSGTLADLQKRLDATETELAVMRAANTLSEADVKHIAHEVSLANIRGAAEGLVDGVVGIEADINKRIDATAVSLATEAARLRDIVGSSTDDAISILRDGAYHFAHGA
jgi:hypothetical protein